MKKTIYRSLKIVYDSSQTLFLLCAFTTLFSAIISRFSIYSIQNLVNRIQMALTSNEDVKEALFLFFVVNISTAFVNHIKSFYSQKLNNNTNYYLDDEFITKCSKLPLKDFESEKTYDAISRANELGKNKVIDMYFNILQLVESIISILAVVIIVLQIDRILWLIILIIPVISTIMNIKIGKFAYNLEKNNIEHSRQKNYINYLLTNNIAIKEIISFNTGNYLAETFKSHNKALKDANERVINKYTRKNMFLTVLELVVKKILISIIILQSIRNNGLIGNIMGFIYSVDLIEARIQAVLSSVTTIYKDKLYVDNYFEFNDRKNEENYGEKTINESIDKISIKNLSFSYTDEKKIPKNVNLTINRKRPVAIIGVNGSGKSTLIKILAGLYGEYSGDILINQFNLRELNITEYRKKIAAIFQNFNKYELTLRENIAFSDIDSISNDIKIRKTIKLVGLTEVLKEFDCGIDTQMGHWFGGVELSKGQWQRVALARAFFKDADIIIMDEPTSLLDPIIEKQIFDLISYLSKEKILILITHRIENLEPYNPWYVLMEQGEIKTQGSIKNIQKNELYKKLLYKQVP
jgi:ABC-type multidrug transport system fused ATPase/permease subunit